MLEIIVAVIAGTIAPVAGRVRHVLQIPEKEQQNTEAASPSAD